MVGGKIIKVVHHYKQTSQSLTYTCMQKLQYTPFPRFLFPCRHTESIKNGRVLTNERLKAKYIFCFSHTSSKLRAQ